MTGWHQVNSLRKSSDLLDQAYQAWTQGIPLALPTECGYFLCSAQTEEVWLSDQAPEAAAGSPLASLAKSFWPGPLRLHWRGPGGKTAWQVVSHPLARAWLQRVGGPVPARSLDWLSPPQPPPGGMLGLVWKAPCLGLSWSEVDLSSQPWRWLRTGFIERRALEWVGGQTTLLSQR